MNNDNLSKAIFGSFDGLCCVLGVIAASYIAGDIHTLILASVGLALSESIAMAGGSYLSEVTNVQSVQHAAIIGSAAFVGVLIPALPFLFVSRTVAIGLSALLTCLFAVVIAQVRVPSLGIIAAYVQTFAIVLVAAIISVLVTLLLNRVGA